ncbi:MAG: CAP domain-containing protein [Chloroflexi bacterium]|nr:CAP domain-containing protein [Chloroflexota bacterium]MBV9898083.1 CAP domain-containing protein [Chloroflexota bacterium]
MRRVLVSCLVLASMLTSTTVAGAEPADSNSFALRVLELTNAERQSAGLTPLTLNSQLTDSAQTYSQVLASSGCFDHTCGPVPNFADRDGQAGYTGWSNLGENIAGGYSTPEAVVAGWMASPGHRENILSPEFTEIGIGIASGSGQFGTYWTQEFGTRD